MSPTQIITLAILFLTAQLLVAIRVSIILGKPSRYFRILPILGVLVALTAFPSGENEVTKIVMVGVIAYVIAIVLASLGSLLLILDYRRASQLSIRRH